MESIICIAGSGKCRLNDLACSSKESKGPIRCKSFRSKSMALLKPLNKLKFSAERRIMQVVRHMRQRWLVTVALGGTKIEGRLINF